jgi:ferric-dicitrate binding protein FerR (iron transport regulator)
MAKKGHTYQSINQSVNQSFRYYRVPSSIGKDAALSSLLSGIHSAPRPAAKTVVIPAWVRIASGIAAVLAVVALLWSGLATFTVNNNGKEVFSSRMPDQTRVILTPGSTATYRNFITGKRVKLQGTGYFEVIPGNKFRVITPEGSVAVLGTRFLVKEAGAGLEVVCYQGKVNVMAGNQQAMLEAGKGIRMAGGTAETLLEKPDSYPPMARFSATYSHAPLEEVAGDLARFFGVPIESQSKQKRFFSGSMDTGSLEAALSILTGSLQLRYDFPENEKVIIY